MYIVIRKVGCEVAAFWKNKDHTTGKFIDLFDNVQIAIGILSVAYPGVKIVDNV